MTTRYLYNLDGDHIMRRIPLEKIKALTRNVKEHEGMQDKFDFSIHV